VRYRLPISAAALVFLLTSREELGLRIRGTVREPSVSRLLGIRSTEAFEG
jgi:branched-subunit amino acid ABC-type transport system permease component